MDSQLNEPVRESGRLGDHIDAVCRRVVERIPAQDDRDAQEAAARRRTLMGRLYMELGPRYSPDRVRLDRFEVYDPAQRDVLQRVQVLADTIPEWVGRGAGLILYGAVGTGKDHLLASLLYAATGQHGIPCRWINAQEFFGEFRDRIDKGAPEADLLHRLSEPQILAMSDPIPPLGDPSAWNCGQLYRLLDRRYRLMKSTWITLNAQSIADADARLTSPVLDRLHHSAEVIRCFWPSYRMRPAQAS